jgi:hypothetical protein
MVCLRAKPSPPYDKRPPKLQAKPREQQIQRAVMDHLRWRGVPGLFAFHVALGGYRRPIEAAILKSLGTVAGIPDLILVHAGRTYGLELKSDNGRLRMREAGAQVATVYGLDEALGQLTEWRLLRGASS